MLQLSKFSTANAAFTPSLANQWWKQNKKYLKLFSRFVILEKQHSSYVHTKINQIVNLFLLMSFFFKAIKRQIEKTYAISSIIPPGVGGGRGMCRVILSFQLKQPYISTLHFWPQSLFTRGKTKSMICFSLCHSYPFISTETTLYLSKIKPQHLYENPKLNFKRIANVYPPPAY
jgi:hypothetical protein